MGAVDRHESMIQWKISRVYQFTSLSEYLIALILLTWGRNGPDRACLLIFLYSSLNILGCDVTMWSVNNWIVFREV